MKLITTSGMCHHLSRTEEQRFHHHLGNVCDQWHGECLRNNTSAGFVVEISGGSGTEKGMLSVVSLGLGPFMCLQWTITDSSLQCADTCVLYCVKVHVAILYCFIGPIQLILTQEPASRGGCLSTLWTSTLYQVPSDGLLRGSLNSLREYK